MSHTPEERAAFMEQKKRQASHNVYQVLMDVFGANGTIPGVETQPLNIPEGLDEKTVAAIVAGSSLNPYRMSYPMGDFAAGSDITVNDQDLVMNQVTGGHVTPQTAGILAAGRRDAQTALEAYRAGDDSLVKRHLKTYADHAVKKLGELTPDCNDPAALGQIALISDILNEDRFGITPSGLLISTEKLKAFRKAGDAGVQAGAQQQRLISEFDTLSQAEKEELAAEMLFNSYISAVPGAGQKQISEQVDQYIRKGLLPMGVSPEDPELYEQVKNDPAIIEETVKMRRNCHHMSITDEEAILAQDTGMDQLRELSMEEIKKSDLFKSIVNAKNKEELTDTLIDAQAQSANGFGSLEGVVIPAVSEEMNAQFQQMRETKITASLDKIPRAAANSAALNEMKAPYIINGLSPAHLGQAGSLAQQIYDLLTAAAPLEEDPAYMEIMATAHSTLKVANDPQGPGLFISGFERTTSLISNYISSGVQIEPEKLKALQQANLMAAAAADSLKASVLQRKEELTQKYGSEFYNTYVRNKNANFGKFPGEAYADPNKRPKVGSMSLERTGGHSMACLYLCSQGYSLEDIVDPDKLIEEKQAAFAHVVDLFKKPEDQAIKDIAKLMYDGRKAEFAQLDQLVKKIDFSDPELMNKKEMQILAQMMFIDFDIGQEVVRCKPEMVEAAKNDPDVHITSFKDYLNAYPILPLSNWISAMGGASEKVAELMTETSPDSLKKALGEIAGCRAQQNYILDAYKNAQKKNPDVPFTKMLPPDFALESGKVQASGKALKKAENSPLDLLANDEVYSYHHPLPAHFFKERSQSGTALRGFILAVGRHMIVAHNTAVTQIQDPCATQSRFQIMRHHDDALTVFVNFREDVQHITGRCGVERTSRLVGKEYLRIVDDRSHDTDSLCLAAGKLIRIFLPVLLMQTDFIEQSLCLVHKFGSILLHDERPCQHIVKHRLVIKQIHALKDESAVATAKLCKLIVGVVLDLRVPEIDLAEGGLIHSRQRIQKR